MTVTEDSASILVVDDNPLIVNVLKSLFHSVEYKVYCSNNGKEAKEILDRKSIDVIICDVMMPEMDGYDFHNYVREQPEFCHIPFVFLTALSSIEDRKAGTEIGADDYIVKPFDPGALLSIVKGKVVRSRGLQNLSEERYDRYRKRVIHTLSHEFRTPLVAINTGTELLIEQGGSLETPRVTNLLQAIQRGGQRLEKLVSDFMLLQQIEAGVALRLYTNRHTFKNLADLVCAHSEARIDDIEEAGFSFQLTSHCQDEQVDVYEPHILDIFDRLISNALKFHQDTKEIEFFIYPQESEVCIEVRDRGIGMDIDHVHEAIDVFGQIDRETLEQQGGGLGLSIANRYASLNKGRLEFENRKDGGSIARLVLPRAERKDYTPDE